MGIFKGLFRSRDKPQNRTAGSSYAFYMGSSTAGKNVTERSAMQMTAVYSCVRVLSEAVAGLPLHVYKYRSDGGKEKAFTHPLYRLLHDEPNPEMTSFVFRETLMTHLLLWGNAYAQVIRNGKGEVIALYPLMPNRMSVDRDSSGNLYYKYYRGSDEAIRSKEYEVILSSGDVLHIPGLGFDGLVGYSPIAMAKNAIGLAIATEEFGAKFFANGAAPSGVLEHPGTIKDPSKVREAWQSQFGGSSNSGKVAVLEEGMKYTPISISPEQAQFLETRKFQINEIDGIAASAASVIAMAGNKVLMSPVSMLMIHNPMTVAMGDTAEMQKAIEMLSEVKESIMNAYEIKTGMSRAKISHLMDAETWMNANKAVELGFADGILTREEPSEAPAADSLMYSETQVVNSLMGRIAEKCRIAPKTEHKTKAEDLFSRLDLIRNWR